jgi:hypothetical protein
MAKVWGLHFQKTFPELCQEPHCWPRERDLKSSDCIGFKTLHLKNLSLFEQRQELNDIQIYGWKVFEGLLGHESPYKSEDLLQFVKWMIVTKVYHNYTIREIKNDLILVLCPWNEANIYQ